MGPYETIVLLLVLTAYFLPSLVAMWRNVSSIGSVVVINLFLGWTFVGWVVALAMAARSAPTRDPARSVSSPPGA